MPPLFPPHLPILPWLLAVPLACPNCLFNLSGLVEPERCPECAFDVRYLDLPIAWKTQLRLRGDRLVAKQDRY